MARDLKDTVHKIINTQDLGVSFSVKNCREYGINWEDALRYTLQMGFKRFRLMSYWDLHEPSRGNYDFDLLHAQHKIILESGGRVTQCLGIRQPRWPECHIPDWAKELPKDQATKAYLEFQKRAVLELKNYDHIESWQLENEFWLKSFGEHFDFSRTRLNQEFMQIRALDPNRPIIMSLANTFSLPVGRPKPDIYATSMYRNLYDNGAYRKTYFSPLYYKMRRLLIRMILRRDLIIHELQAEPWGPKSNWEMSSAEQFITMNVPEIKTALEFARQSGIPYIDMWGAEWWYWRTLQHNDHTITATLSSINKAVQA